MVLFLFFVLIICFLDIVMILWWEILSWSLMGVRVKEKSSISAFNKTLYLLELRQVSCCESLGILCHLQIKFTEPKKKTSHIENNSQFSIETLILSLLQFLCSLISRFILSFAVFFFCLFHVFYINLELHIVSYLK